MKRLERGPPARLLPPERAGAALSATHSRAAAEKTKIRKTGLVFEYPYRIKAPDRGHPDAKGYSARGASVPTTFRAPLHGARSPPAQTQSRKGENDSASQGMGSH